MIFEFSRFYEKIGVEKPSKENVFECFNQAVGFMSNLGNVEVVNECQGLVVLADSLLNNSSITSSITRLNMERKSLK